MQLPRMFLGDLAKGGGESPPDGPPWGVEPGDEQDSKDNGVRLLRSLNPLPGSPLPPPPDPPPSGGPPWGVEPGDEKDSKDNGIRLLRALKPFLPPSPPPPSGPPWGVEPGDEEAPKKARKITRSKNP